MTELAEIKPGEETERIVNDLSTLENKANTLKMTTDHDYQIANEIIKTCKMSSKVLDERRKTMTKPLDESKKRIMELFKAPLDRVKALTSKVNMMMLEYQRKKEEERRKEEERLRKIAEKEEERKRAALQKKADKAREKGDEQKAEALEDQKEDVFVPKPVLADNKPKAQGTTIIKTWKFRIIDQNKIPKKYWVVSEPTIGRDVRNHKGNIEIPGVEIYCEEQIKSTGR